MAGVVAEAVLKPLRLLVWKVMLDCLDMVAERGWRGELSTRVRVKGDGEDGASGEPRAVWAFMGLGEGRVLLMEASDGIPPGIRQP